MSLSILLVPFTISTTLAAITTVTTISTAINNFNKEKNTSSTTTKREINHVNNVNFANSITYEVIETDMKDEKLLKKSIEHFKYNIKVGAERSDILADIVFSANENGNFTVKYNKEKKAEYLPVISAIREEYGKKVQETVYENILKNHQKQGFILENEVVEDDNSITLVFDTGDR